MSLSLRYERISFKRRVLENAAESVVEGSLTLPSGARPIGRALRLSARPRVKEVEVKEDRVIFEGDFDLDLLYTYYEERRVNQYADPPGDDEAFDDERDELEVVVQERLARVEWSDELPFAYVLELPGVAEGQAVKHRVSVEDISYEVRSDESTVDVDLSLRFEAYTEESVSLDVATGVEGADGVEVEVKPVRVKNQLGKGEGEAKAEGELALPERAAPPSVVDVRASADVAEVFVDDGFVRVKGYVSYDILFQGAGDPEGGTWRRGATFEAEIPVEGARRGAKAEVQADAGETRVHLVEDESGRRLEVRTPVALSVVVVLVREVPIVTKVSAGDKEVALRHERISLHECVGEGSATQTSDVTLEIPEGSPGVERVLTAWARAGVDDVHVLGDKVAVEVHVDVESIYVGKERGESSVYSAKWPGAFTLDVEVPVEGAEPGLERRVHVQVDRVEVDPINRESLDVRVQLTTNVAVSREIELDAVVEAVEVPPVEEDPPTYTFVVVEEGETLWRLAARYRSETGAIVAVNPWLESDAGALPVGRKVCVPRKVMQATP